MLAIGVDAHCRVCAGLEQRAETAAQRAALALVLCVTHDPRARRSSGLARAIRRTVVDDHDQLFTAFACERIEQAANHGCHTFFRLIGGDHETDLHFAGA